MRVKEEVRATTIRFPNDLWDQLEAEARRQGISVAQYVRDAALYRLAYSAGATAEGEPPKGRGRSLPPSAAKR
jgi:hypothetical protein